MRLHELRALVEERCNAGHEMDRVKVLVTVDGGHELVFTPDELLSLKCDPIIYLTVEESLDVD